MSGAPSPNRSTSEVRVAKTFTAEIVLHVEDGASAEANNDLMEHQIKEELKLIRKHTDFENITLED